MEALVLSYPFSMVGDMNGVGCLPVAPLHAPSSCAQTEKKASSFHVHCYSFGFFVSKGNEQERRKTRRIGKMKTNTIFSLPWAKPEP